MTYIHITIDTEFSSCGYFNDPPSGEPVADQAVRCIVNRRSEGLGFMLETFANYGIKATFFVEALQTLYFGDKPMGAIAREILGHGHDVQVHLHPSWMACAVSGTPERPLRPAADNFGALDLETAVYAVSLAVEAFERWGMPRPIAFRAGNLQASLSSYRALERLGIPIASNLGLGVYLPAEPELHITNGRRRVGGVIEVPTTTYAVPWPLGRRQQKTLSITGSSSSETRSVIAQGQAGRLDDIVVLTHPFEFVKRGDHNYRRLTRNRVNQNRLVALCRHIADPANGLRSATFSERAAAWMADGDHHERDLTAPFVQAALRMGVNVVNDRIWRY